MNNNYHTQVNNKDVLKQVAESNKLEEPIEIELTDLPPNETQQKCTQSPPENVPNVVIPPVEPHTVPEQKKSQTDVEVRPNKTECKPYYVVSIVIFVMIVVLFHPMLNEKISKYLFSLESTKGILARSTLIILCYLAIQKGYDRFFKK